MCGSYKVEGRVFVVLGLSRRLFQSKGTATVEYIHIHMIILFLAVVVILFVVRKG